MDLRDLTTGDQLEMEKEEETWMSMWSSAGCLSLLSCSKVNIQGSTLQDCRDELMNQSGQASQDTVMLDLRPQPKNHICPRAFSITLPGQDSKFAGLPAAEYSLKFYPIRQPNKRT